MVRVAGDRNTKKPNKAEREKKRAEKANIYEMGYKHGYEMGYEQGFKDAIEKTQRNTVKWSHFGR